MQTVHFNLVDYTMDIQRMANEHKCSPEKAMGMFIANLAVMKEHYKGAPHLNYHELGQLWNALKGDERNNQKNETRNRLSKSKRGGAIE